MDKSRQQFEEFIKFHMDDAEIKNKFETANKGLNYSDRDVDLMWISWQASSESLINNLEPVGYIGAISLLRIRRNEKAYIYPDNNIKTIPLYRLDK